MVAAQRFDQHDSVERKDDKVIVTFHVCGPRSVAYKCVPHLLGAWKQIVPKAFFSRIGTTNYYRLNNKRTGPFE